jgi:sigma-B regulation protein RsbU (phosphoserine phosphatase)
MTMSLMVVDPERGVVRYACAAHDPILAYEPAGDTFRELEEGSIPLGAMAGTEYEEYTANGFRPGTVLLLGTDGIWEARNAADEMFGKERLQAAVRGAARDGGTSRAITSAVNDALNAFLAGRPIQDDVTFVVARMTD